MQRTVTQREGTLLSAKQILDKLMSDPADDATFRTDSRAEYEVLFEAARNGLFPDRLELGRTGVWVQKRLVHTPPRGEQ